MTQKETKTQTTAWEGIQYMVNPPDTSLGLSSVMTTESSPDCALIFLGLLFLLCLILPAADPRSPSSPPWPCKDLFKIPALSPSKLPILCKVRWNRKFGSLAKLFPQTLQISFFFAFSVLLWIQLCKWWQKLDLNLTRHSLHGLNANCSSSNCKL